MFQRRPSENVRFSCATLENVRFRATSVKSDGLPLKGRVEGVGDAVDVHLPGEPLPAGPLLPRGLAAQGERHAAAAGAARDVPGARPTSRRPC